MSIDGAQITIKQGQGVTHALRDLVNKNKMKMSDGSISKTEWNETVKVLDQIEAERKANGKASIFGGDNHLVNAGDKIDFTADEMEKIYKAMGVEFEAPAKTDAPKPKESKEMTPVGIDDPKPAKPAKPTKPGNKLTPKERNEARHYGSNVSDYLVGYTDDSEKGLTKEVITKNVNNRNVMDFLAGYEKNKGMGDHFFTQLNSEYGFEEKQNLMKNVAGKLSVYLKNHGQSRLAREVDVALQDNGFTPSEIKKLDQIVQTMLTDVPGLRD